MSQTASVFSSSGRKLTADDRGNPLGTNHYRCLCFESFTIAGMILSGAVLTIPPMPLL